NARRDRKGWLADVRSLHPRGSPSQWQADQDHQCEQAELAAPLLRKTTPEEEEPGQKAEPQNEGVRLGNHQRRIASRAWKRLPKTPLCATQRNVFSALRACWAKRHRTLRGTLTCNSGREQTSAMRSGTDFRPRVESGPSNELRSRDDLAGRRLLS